MKLLRQKKLHFQNEKSDKVYEVDLCQITDNTYVVNFRYGRRGNTLNEGTKTTEAVDFAKANQIFNQLVDSKIQKGYQESDVQHPVVLQDNSKTEFANIPPITGEFTPQVQTIVNYIQQYNSDSTFQVYWKPSRIIWRAGEIRLKELIPHLTKLYSNPDMTQMTKYSIIWSLARMRSEDTKEFLHKVYTDPNTDRHIRRIARLGYFDICNDNERQNLTNQILEQLPKDIASFIPTGDLGQDLQNAITTQIRNPQIQDHTYLSDLYLISTQYQHVHTALVAVLREVELKAGIFRPIRHIFKSSELRDDFEILGLLGYRFETSHPNFRRLNKKYGWTRYAEGAVKTAEELQKDTSRLAFSNRTQLYLKRRLKRILQTLAVDGNTEGFVTLSTNYLINISDKRDFRPVHRFVSSKWIRNSQTGRYESNTSTVHYDEMADYINLYYLLYGGGSRYALSVHSRNWYCVAPYIPGGPEPEHREDIFAHMWDMYPDAVLRLLTEAKSKLVHKFACKVFRANPNFENLVSRQIVIEMLTSGFESTAQLGLELFLKLYKNDVDISILQALLQSTLEAARQTAKQLVLQNRRQYLGDTVFVVAIITSRFADIQEWAKTLFMTDVWNSDQMSNILNTSIEQILTFDYDSLELTSIAQGVQAILQLHFISSYSSIELDLIKKLLVYPVDAYKVLGASILENLDLNALELSPEIFDTLLNNDSEELQSLAVKLYHKLSTVKLLEIKESLLGMTVSPKPNVRMAARTLVQDLAKTSPEFGRYIQQALTSMILTKEIYKGLNHDIYVLLTEYLPQTLSNLSKEQIWAMLKFRGKSAQKLGTFVLETNLDKYNLDLSDFLFLASHDVQRLREMSWEYFANNLDSIKTEKEKALTILDSKWEDSRNFAFEYFKSNFSSTDWTPALLVSICDSVRDDVQKFGRELISIHFQEEDGIEYLLKLSQHPSTNLQLFATNYLERFASGSYERIQDLELYFLTVLSHINKARVAKDRILKFLHAEAIANESIAALVAKILTRQSLTMLIADKAASIEILRDIKKRFANIEVPIQINNYKSYEL